MSRSNWLVTSAIGGVITATRDAVTFTGTESEFEAMLLAENPMEATPSEPVITPSTTTKYWRGDKTFQTLISTVVTEGANLYFTATRSLGAALTGLDTTAGIISSSDTVLSSIGKLVGNLAQVLIDAKAHADSLVVGLLDDRGSYSASVSMFPSGSISVGDLGGSGASSSILKGDLWFVGVAGNGLVIGTSVRAMVDSPGQLSSNWSVISTTLGFTPENAINKSTTLDADKTSDTKYSTPKSVYDWAVGLFCLVAWRVPVGGTSGQVLSKSSSVDNDVVWVTPVGALGSGDVIDSYGIPSNALELNGQAVSRTTYAALFAIIGTNFGAGDGSTTFNVPFSVSGLLTFKDYTAGTDLTATRYYHTATLLGDSRVLLIGGMVAGVASVSTLFLTISGNTITFAAGTDLPATRYQHTATLLGDNRIFVAGGYVAGVASTSTLFLTISGNVIAYAAGTDLPATRSEYTATLLGDNRIFVAGGYVAGVASTSTLFLTISGNVIAYAAGTDLPATRCYHTANRMPNEKILITGGIVAGGFSPSTLLLTISSNVVAYTVTASLPVNRYEHTVTLLSDGTLFLAGGCINGLGSTSAVTYTLTVNGSVITYALGIDLPVTRNKHTANVIDSKVVFIGGWVSNAASATATTLFTNFLKTTKKYIKT